jgi:hypothetical protein
MKTEAEMRAEGRQINRAIDNYEPLTEQPEAQPSPQTTLSEQE